MIGGVVDEVLAVRQEKRPTVGGVLLRVDGGGSRRMAAGGKYLHEPAAKIVGIDDHTIGAPGASAGIGRVSQHGDRTTPGGNAIQFGDVEESDRLSVRRPEGMRGIFSAINPIRL